jgi:hypothetical protein
MTDFIDGLERDLVEAARRRAQATAPRPGRTGTRRARPPLRSLLLAAALLVLMAGSAAGATLLALRGSVIPAPQAVPPEQTPAAGTSRVASLRAADPQRGLLPWTVRVARSETGLLCSTVGQADRAGTFGLVGLDGRFRAIADGVSDSCGTAHDDGISLIGARVFDARARENVRTVVSGVGAEDAIARVQVQTTTGRTFRVPVSGGVFAIALRGYPEDLGIRAIVTDKDGHRETHDFGRSAFVAGDPSGGPAWKLQAFMMSNDGRTCANFSWARPAANAPVSPEACGDLSHGRRRTRSGWYVAVRLLSKGTRGSVPFPAKWGDHPPRVAVWGGVGDDVRAVSVQVGSGPPRALGIPPSRTFLAVLDPKVDPATVTTRFTMKDGRTEVAHGSAHLVAHPIKVITINRTPSAGRTP